MRQIIALALNDLHITLRGRGTQIMMFGMPVILTVLIGMATGSNGGSSLVDVIRGDPADKLAADFVTQLAAEGGKQFVVCDLSDPATQAAQCKLNDAKISANAPAADQITLARQRVQNNVTMAAVALPAGFNADLLAGKNVQVNFINQNGSNSAEIARQGVDAVITRISGAILAAHVAVERANPAANQQQAFYDQVYAAAQTLWAKDPIVVDEHTTTVTGTGIGGMGASAPGMGAMFVMNNVLTAAAAFIRERKEGTLQRLVVLPLTRAQILAGKLLGRFLLGLITFTTMIVVGTLFHVQWGDLSGVIVIVVVYTLAVTALALALSTLVRSAAQAAGVALLITMTLAPLGGAWWPLSIVPQWMQTLGHISPIAWSQDAFNQLVFYGKHLADIMPAVGVLALFAVVFFAFGVSRFRYE